MNNYYYTLSIHIIITHNSILLLGTGVDDRNFPSKMKVRLKSLEEVTLY
jgi:hypothetical protein